MASGYSQQRPVQFSLCFKRRREAYRSGRSPCPAPAQTKLIDGIRIRNDIAGRARAGDVDATVEVIGHLPDDIVVGCIDNHVLHRRTDGVLVLNVLHTRREVQQLVDVAAY
ncbi:MAG: hypothetical protein QOJ42_5232 [Acidobacteriaceae bacterium]|nr:hypothetical protein [Acidobacteriaceae bacterium]